MEELRRAVAFLQNLLFISKTPASLPDQPRIDAVLPALFDVAIDSVERCARDQAAAEAEAAIAAATAQAVEEQNAIDAAARAEAAANQEASDAAEREERHLAGIS